MKLTHSNRSSTFAGGVRPEDLQSLSKRSINGEYSIFLKILGGRTCAFNNDVSRDYLRSIMTCYDTRLFAFNNDVSRVDMCVRLIMTCHATICVQ